MKINEQSLFSLRCGVGIGIALVSLVLLFAFIPAITTAQSSEDVERRRERLQRELEQNQQEQQALQSEVNELQGQERSLERDIQLLEAEIRQAQLSIQQKEIELQRLGRGINEREETIQELTARAARSKDSLAQLLRETDKMNRESLVEIMLRHDNLSDFFVRLDDFAAVQDSLNVSLEEIRFIKAENRRQKEQLSVERDEVQDAKIVIEQEKRTIEQKEGELQELLSIKRSEKQTYEQRLEQKRQRARDIRSALFALRDSAAIPFGEALTFANQARQRTGIRPAFLLAILQQESELGENVGTCNRPGDVQTWRDIMPGPNDNSWRDDQTNFLKITNQLGLNPEGLPLSCPWGNGWGGAMGPSQFIPTTWLEYAPRIQAATGQTPDPWNPEHAFMASALYLTDLGAANGGYTAERTAALKYYAGSNWNNPQNAFYGNQVMNKAQDIQQNMIDPLQEAN